MCLANRLWPFRAGHG